MGPKVEDRVGSRSPRDRLDVHFGYTGEHHWYALDEYLSVEQVLEHASSRFASALLQQDDGWGTVG
jgi:hypothetical protein